MDTSSSIHHWCGIKIPHQNSVDISSIMKVQFMWKVWHRFNLSYLILHCCLSLRYFTCNLKTEIISIIRKNSTALISINIVEVIHLRSQMSKIAGGVELFLIQNNYWNLRQAQECWLLPIYNCWNLKPNNFKYCFI